MPSSRKQRAKEKRSRQSDVMSDMENLDVLVGTYSRNRSDEELDENVDIDSRSNGPRQDMVQSSSSLLDVYKSNILRRLLFSSTLVEWA